MNFINFQQLTTIIINTIIITYNYLPITITIIITYNYLLILITFIPNTN